MNIAMLTMEQYDNRRENSVGSSRIRGRWVMKYTPEIVPFRNGGNYDVMIYQKAYWREHMDTFKGIKIFDICDPDWFDGRPIMEVIEKVDALTVPTEPLQKYLQQLTDKPVVLIPDRIDPEDHVPVKERHIGKMRNVVWFGYGQNQVVLDQVTNVLKKYNLNLVVISNTRYHDADVFVEYNYANFNQELIKYDAVLLPTYTKDFRFTFKSNNKTLTAWALKMPVIAEVDDLERFLDPKEREQEAEMRYTEIMTKWHVKESGREYLELINQLQEARRRG